MIIKFKKLTETARIPELPKSGDVGIDLYVDSITHNNNYIEYGTGLAVEIVSEANTLIDDCYYFQAVPRSSICNKDLILCNSVGIIDPTYRGELKFRFKVVSHRFSSPEARPMHEKIYNVGDKFIQLILNSNLLNILRHEYLDQVHIKEVSELSNTERGEGGFGSTGVK